MELTPDARQLLRLSSAFSTTIIFVSGLNSLKRIVAKSSAVPPLIISTSKQLTFNFNVNLNHTAAKIYPVNNSAFGRDGHWLRHFVNRCSGLFNPSAIYYDNFISNFNCLVLIVCHKYRRYAELVNRLFQLIAQILPNFPIYRCERFIKQ